MIAGLLLGCKPERVNALKKNEPLRPHIGIFVADTFGDHSFNDLALAGKTLIQNAHLGEVHTYEGRMQIDRFFRTLSHAGRRNDFVYVLGFEALDALFQAAQENPKAHFIFIELLGQTSLISAIRYRSQEGCFITGALAARLEETLLPPAHRTGAVGFVGGTDAPVIRQCLSGYEQGVHEVNPAMRVLVGWVGSFVDPAKGKQVNQLLNQQGSWINFEYAGLSGEGGFDNVKAGDAGFALGSGTDQSYLAPGYVPASLEERVDLSILKTARGIVSGRLKRGFDSTEGITDGGQQMAYDNHLVSSSIRAEMGVLIGKIARGQVVVRE